METGTEASGEEMEDQNGKDSQIRLLETKTKNIAIIGEIEMNNMGTFHSDTKDRSIDTKKAEKLETENLVEKRAAGNDNSESDKTEPGMMQQERTDLGKIKAVKGNAEMKTKNTQTEEMVVKGTKEDEGQEMMNTEKIQVEEANTGKIDTAKTGSTREANVEKINKKKAESEEATSAQKIGTKMADGSKIATDETNTENIQADGKIGTDNAKSKTNKLKSKNEGGKTTEPGIQIHTSGATNINAEEDVGKTETEDTELETIKPRSKNKSEKATQSEIQIQIIRSDTEDEETADAESERGLIEVEYEIHINILQM